MLYCECMRFAPKFAIIQTFYSDRIVRQTFLPWLKLPSGMQHCSLKVRKLSKLFFVRKLNIYIFFKIIYQVSHNLPGCGQVVRLDPWPSGVKGQFFFFGYIYIFFRSSTCRVVAGERLGSVRKVRPKTTIYSLYYLIKVIKSGLGSNLPDRT